ncbi:hypothetical protein B7463_g4080, partial [Scytalidium lignicola]
MTVLNFNLIVAALGLASVGMAAPLQSYGPYFNSSNSGSTVYVTVTDCPMVVSSYSPFGFPSSPAYSVGLSTVSAISAAGISTRTSTQTLERTTTITAFTSTTTVYFPSTSTEVSPPELSSTESIAIQTITETVIPIPSTCYSTELPTSTVKSTVYVTTEYTIVMTLTTEPSLSSATPAITSTTATATLSTSTIASTTYITHYYTITKTLSSGSSSAGLEAPTSGTLGTTTVTDVLVGSTANTVVPANTTATPVPINTTTSAIDSARASTSVTTISINNITEISFTLASSISIGLTPESTQSHIITAYGPSYGPHYSSNGYNSTSTPMISSSIKSISYVLPTVSVSSSTIGINPTASVSSAISFISTIPVYGASTISSSSYSAYGEATSSTSPSSDVTSIYTPTSTQAACGEQAEFSLNFDDIPPLSVYSQNYNTTKPAPIFSPYHKFGFTNGFVVVPPPTAPYLPSSGKQLAEFIPNAVNVNTHESSTTGQIYDANGTSGCYNFNVYGASFGCNSTGPDCDFIFTGYQYLADTRSKFTVAAQHVSIPACPTLENCALEKVALDGSFKSLTSIQINVTVAGSAAAWWMDDLKLGWYDNSCETQLCRKN